ncbi:MAG: nucleotide sugar dehydrogenase [Microgenomates group bacterium]
MQRVIISVIGLGKLGLPLALLYAKEGYSVIGYDVLSSSIESLRSGKAPIAEKGIERILSENKKNVSFTTEVEDVAKSDMTFVVVPTPSKTDGSFSSTHIEEVLRALSPSLKKKKGRHIIVITSTVSPGTMEAKIKPLIERLTKKKIGADIGLCYSPELIALGSVIHDMQHPDLIFIGESDTKTGNQVSKIRKSICKNSPPIIQTNWINAELVKLSLNAYITSKISYANMVARICERTPHADSRVVLQTMGLDSRIGTKYLKGGLGYGGPCFPRDTRSLSAAIKEVGLNIQLPQATHDFNQSQTQYLFDVVQRYIKKNDRVGILGLGYKQGTDVIDESQGMMLLKLMVSRSIYTIAFDPLAMQNAKKNVPTARFAKSMEECISKSDIVILTTPWDDFKHIQWQEYKRKTIIDCWQIVDLAKQNIIQNTFIQLGKYLPSP